MAIAVIVSSILVGPAALLWGRRLAARRRRTPAAWHVSRRSDVPIAIRRLVAGRGRIVIRRADADDTGALGRLFQLAERPTPREPVLLAEADGQLVAVVSTVTGETVSDPFVATADVVALLRLRAQQLYSTQLDSAA